MAVSKSGSKWVCKIVFEGVPYHVGTFGTEASAREAEEREYAAVHNGTSELVRAGLTTYQAYAKKLGIRHGTLKQWVNAGLPVVTLASGIPRIDPVAADAWVKANRVTSIAVKRVSLLYFAQRSSDDAIKIGWSSDPVRRIRELEKKQGCDVVLLGAVPGDKPDELALHERFKKSALGEEWFRSTPELLAYLKSCWRLAS